MTVRTKGLVVAVVTSLSSVASAQTPPAPGPVAAEAISRRGYLAQHYQPFRTDFGFGYANVLDQKTHGGSISVEPKLNILDNLAVGARVEAMIGGGGDVGGETTEVKQHVAVATLLKADYFLTRAAVRPWVGFGVGRYGIAAQGTKTSDDGASVNQNAGAYFGVAPQIGLEMGGFRIGATYNKIIGAQVEVKQEVGGETRKKTYSHDYVSIELGFRIGGRRR